MSTGTEPEPGFEADLARLESIVDDLERGEPALSAALAKYEEGVRLLARCHGVLDQAERSVDLLAGVDGDGNAVVSPFDETTSAGADPAPPARPAPRVRKRPPASSGDGGESPLPF